MMFPFSMPFSLLNGNLVDLEVQGSHSQRAVERTDRVRRTRDSLERFPAREGRSDRSLTLARSENRARDEISTVGWSFLNRPRCSAQYATGPESQLNSSHERLLPSHAEPSRPPGVVHRWRLGNGDQNSGFARGGREDHLAFDGFAPGTRAVGTIWSNRLASARIPRSSVCSTQ